MSALTQADREGISIVLLGAFNPRIFQPAWFVSRGLLPPSAADQSQILMINNDLCTFATDWCRIEVVAERFAVFSQNAVTPEQVRDLVLGTFAVLEHTPVGAVGINLWSHHVLSDPGVLQAVGDVLAPKAGVWESLDGPRTTSLTVQGSRPDAYKGHIRVKVEPSTVFEPALFIEVNDEFRHDPEAPASTWVPDVLSDQWEPCVARWRSIRTSLLERAADGRIER